MRTLHYLSLAIIPLSFSLSSCGQRSIRGAGADGTQTHTVAAFSIVDLAGSEDVEFLPADAPRVEITGYKNLLPYYKATVKNGTLSLGFNSGEGIRTNIRNSNLRVRVYSPGFKSLDLAGSGNVVIKPGASIPVQEVEIAGSGDVTIEQADAQELSLEIAGSGNIHARNAHAAIVKAEIAGSGNIETTPTNRLEAEIAGSGNIEYWGTPQVSKDVAGSGDVVKR